MSACEVLECVWKLAQAAAHVHSSGCDDTWRMWGSAELERFIKEIHGFTSSDIVELCIPRMCSSSSVCWVGGSGTTTCLDGSFNVFSRAACSKWALLVVRDGISLCVRTERIAPNKSFLFLFLFLFLHDCCIIHRSNCYDLSNCCIIIVPIPIPSVCITRSYSYSYSFGIPIPIHK